MFNDVSYEFVITSDERLIYLKLIYDELTLFAEIIPFTTVLMLIFSVVFRLIDVRMGKHICT